MRRRVVMTGLGPVTGFGLGIDVLWNAMCEGRSAIGPMTRFDPAGFACRAAAELSDELFSIRKLVPKSYRKSTKVMCRDIELAVAAAASAVEDAKLITKGIDPDAEPTIAPERFGCHIGAGLIAADVDELSAALVTSQREDGSFDIRDWGAQGMQNLTPLWLLKYLPNMLACHVTIVHDCQGPSNTITCCEASAALSLGESMRVIERGVADACLTGGADYKLNPLAYLRLDFAKRLAPTEGFDDPAAAVRPFAPDAAGSIAGEGGGLIVVEGADTAAERGAHVYATVEGYAATQSFCADTIGLEGEADGQSLADAMTLALRDAGCSAEAIDVIVPFGSGIPSVDASEQAAIERVFGERATSIPLITTIPFTGNCCAGNSAIALAVGAKILDEQRLPARLQTMGSSLNANAAPSTDATVGKVLVVTTSQGGQNAALVLGRPE